MALHLYSAAGPTEAQAVRTGGRDGVLAALLAARQRTLALAEDWQVALGGLSLGIPYAAELNPPLWELGHIAWFQEWWISRNRQRALGAACDPLHDRPASVLPQADAWYDSSQVAHHSRWHLPLPTTAATHAYLAQTLQATLAELAALPPEPDDDALYFFRLVALHECMHAEASTYMAQTLALSLSRQPVAAVREPSQELRLAAQPFELGSRATGFAFDNEHGHHVVEVAPLQIDAQAVSWQRFLPFVEAGGYEDPRWWTEAGASWLVQLPQRQPACLRLEAGAWQQRRGRTWHALQPEQPAIHLNAHEAEAWCRWAGRRLPTEAEWECAALTLPGFAWGQVWEWTASPFTPYPGFAAHPYRDYSAPWFGSRRVLRGASAATDPHIAHARYRNFFEPHRRDIFAGFRSVAGLAV